MFRGPGQKVWRPTANHRPSAARTRIAIRPRPTRQIQRPLDLHLRGFAPRGLLLDPLPQDFDLLGVPHLPVRKRAIMVRRVAERPPELCLVRAAVPTDTPAEDRRDPVPGLPGSGWLR